MTEASLELCLVLLLLVPLAIAGLSLVNGGLGRSHSSAHAMLSSLCVVSVAAIFYLFVGAGLMGYADEPGYGVTIARHGWNWFGSENFFLHHLDAGHAQSALTGALELFAVAMAALIPLSAGADRWRLGASSVSTALLASLLYPLFGHWVWGGGWLAQLGAQHGMGRGFLDMSGAGTVQAVGGISALAVTWLLGPRRNKYLKSGMATAIPGHNIVIVLFGCALMLPGWMALNAAGAMLFYQVPVGLVPLIAVNTLLCGAGSLLAALGLTRWRFGKPDASLCANGWVGGLVASSAAAAWISPLSALLTGLVAGVLIIYTVEFLELKFFVDDPAGAVSVHAVTGIWGLLSAGIFARDAVAGQMLAQLVGVATLLGCVLPLTYLVNWCAQCVYRYRIDDDGERLGIDLHELGAGAYPEFVVHGDEFIQR
jgi:Amt family ammonium transporter